MLFWILHWSFGQICKWSTIWIWSHQIGGPQVGSLSGELNTKIFLSTSNLIWLFIKWVPHLKQVPPPKKKYTIFLSQVMWISSFFVCKFHTRCSLQSLIVIYSQLSRCTADKRPCTGLVTEGPTKRTFYLCETCKYLLVNWLLTEILLMI